MNLTVQMKDKYATSLMHRVFDPRIEVWHKTFKAVYADDLYRTLVTEEEEALLKSLPYHFVRMSPTITLDFRANGRSRCEHDLPISSDGRSRHFGAQVLLTPSCYNSLVKLDDIETLTQTLKKAGHPAREAIRLNKGLQIVVAQVLELRELQEEKLVFRNTLFHSLRPIRTLKALENAWPEAVEDFVEVVGAKQKFLPAPVFTQLNDIALPTLKAQKKEEKAA